ncbi:hypothetical protein D3C87_1804060 [compost metagenome]
MLLAVQPTVPGVWVVYFNPLETNFSALPAASKIWNFTGDWMIFLAEPDMPVISGVKNVWMLCGSPFSETVNFRPSNAMLFPSRWSGI